MGNILKQSYNNIKEFQLLDFMEYLGQKAIEIKYNDGKIQMLTTKSNKQNVYASHDFDSIDAYNHFIDILRLKNIKEV